MHPIASQTRIGFVETAGIVCNDYESEVKPVLTIFNTICTWFVLMIVICSVLDSGCMSYGQSLYHICDSSCSLSSFPV